MSAPIAIIFCNAIEDITRLERGIYTDSPAASKKVFEMSQALRKAGVRSYIFSFGRGKTNGSFKFYSRKLIRVNGVPVIYAPFTHIPLVSEFLSFFGLLDLLFRWSNQYRKASVFYNRTPGYLFLMFLSKILGYRCFLDLEDGELIESETLVNSKYYLKLFNIKLFDYFCNDGVLLACKALFLKTKIRPCYYYYGVVKPHEKLPIFLNPEITFLMSGTLDQTTGADLLIEAIKYLRSQQDEWIRTLSFEITGYGSAIDDLLQFESAELFPKVIVHGRLTYEKYLKVLYRCDVGLALKPNGGCLADTTFPSKTIEYASRGLLVASTDISDVRDLLEDGACYLSSNNRDDLIKLLRDIVINKELSKSKAEIGHKLIVEKCNLNLVSQELRSFITRD